MEGAVFTAGLQVICKAVAGVETTFTTTDDGRMGVSVLLMRSSTTENDASPLGVTRQEQQETNCSSGE